MDSTSENRMLCSADEDVFLNALNEPVLVFDAAGTVVKTNQAGMEFLGFNPAGKQSIDIAACINFVSEGSTGQERTDIISGRVLGGETISAAPCVFMIPGKEETQGEFTAVPCKHNNEICGAVCIWRTVIKDIPAEKKAIGVLAAAVAHELRNPLGVILAAVYNIEHKNKDKELNSHLENIRQKIRESEKIINNFLHYARIKKPNFRKVNFYLLLDECIKNVESLYEDSGIQINSAIEIFKDVLLEIDPVHVSEVITNVLNNACQAFPEKPGTVEITGELLSASAIVSIKDNGEGIRTEDIKKIFDPFFTRKSGGTGLGLSLSKDLILLNNGQIDVKSRRGEGTTVQIYLPRKIFYTE